MVTVLPDPFAISDELPSPLLELCEQYRRHALSVRSVTDDTVEEQLLYLKRYFSWLGPPESASALFSCVVPEQVARFLSAYSDGHGPGSRRWMQYSLRSFLRFSYEESYVERDLSVLVPTVRTPRQGHIPRALPDACIAALRTAPEGDSPSELRVAAIVCLLSTYGVRGVQVRCLRLDHLDWENDRIHFPAAKGSRAIDQHLTVEAGNRLVDYITGARHDSPFPEVFLTLTEPFRPIPTSSYLSAVIRGHMKRHGVEPPAEVSRGTHGFRHALATRMIGRVPFKDLVDLLGHRDPSSTLIYGKVDIHSLRQAALPWPGGQQ